MLKSIQFSANDKKQQPFPTNMEESDMVIENPPEVESKEKTGLISKLLAVSPIGEKATAKDWEAVFLAIDKQIISFGLRIILFLPAFALFTYFIAWAFSTGSPKWWLDNIEPTIGLTFSITLVAITFVILFGYILSLIVHRHRLGLSLRVFNDEVKLSNAAHRPVQSLQGYDGLVDRMNRALSKTNTSLLFAIISAVLLSIIFYIGSEHKSGMILLLGSFSLMLLSIGQHLATRSHQFSMVDRTGLLDAYDPAIHPSTINSVFNDLLMTHMDPLMRAQYVDFIKSIETNIHATVEVDFAREKILMTLYRHSSGLDRNTMISELSEVLTDKGLELIVSHEVFTLEVWLSLIEHVSKSCPAFFRMIDRLEHEIEVGNNPALKDLVFEVDLENVVSNRANLFTIIHNLGETERTVVFRVQTPDFRPNDVALTYRLMPGEKYWWSNRALPSHAQGDDDTLGVMSGLLRDGTVAWQSLLPTTTGEATVSIRLEQQSGELLVGRQINVRVRSEFRAMVRSSGSLAANLIGTLGLLSAIFMQMYALFGQY